MGDVVPIGGRIEVDLTPSDPLVALEARLAALELSLSRLAAIVAELPRSTQERAE